MKNNKITTTQIYYRLLAVKQTSVTKEEFGKAIGITKQSISGRIKRNSKITQDEIQKLEAYFQVDLSREETIELDANKKEKTDEEQVKDYLKKELDFTDEEVTLILEKMKDDKFPYLLLAKVQASGDKQAARILKMMFPELKD